ncbi:hypothetical protein BJ742DRAFT_738304 [Cladochytrium replicatum]|nr:hypothetical protein BJ742DRAFT_738304 [Cladochytrium replicatum]
MSTAVKLPENSYIQLGKLASRVSKICVGCIINPTLIDPPPTLRESVVIWSGHTASVTRSSLSDNTWDDGHYFVYRFLWSHIFGSLFSKGSVVSVGYLRLVEDRRLVNKCRLELQAHF